MNLRFVLFTFFFASIFMMREATAASSSTSFSANVPFECSIQNSNSGSVSMSSKASSYGLSFLRLTATAEPLELSGNGLSSVAIDYNQTGGREARNTILMATVRGNAGDNLYTYMQNGSSLLSSEGGVMEGGFPRLVASPRPITIAFFADVDNKAGQTYEFEVTLSCLQKSE